MSFIQIKLKKFKNDVNFLIINLNCIISIYKLYILIFFLKIIFNFLIINLNCIISIYKLYILIF